MDIPVVLSHRTAWLYYHAPFRDSVLAGNTDYGISEPGIPAREVGRRIKQFLVDCGVPGHELEVLHILVAFHFCRTNANTPVFKSHVLGGLLGEAGVHELAPGLFVVCESLCFVQSGTWLTKVERIEFGYELCGRYELSLNGGAHRDRSPLLTRDEALAYVSAHPSVRGAKSARSALVRVRDNSRSPMESATALMIALPRKLGGLGYRGIEVNCRLDVPEHIRPLTKSTELEVDILARRKNVGIEYDGEDHAEALQRARDAERLTTLAAMGIHVHVLTKGQFLEQLSLHRALNGVALDLGLRLNADATFQQAQNNLRLHFIRSWKNTQTKTPQRSAN